jgi:hypothetical protein
MAPVTSPPPFLTAGDVARRPGVTFLVFWLRTRAQAGSVAKGNQQPIGCPAALLLDTGFMQGEQFHANCTD